MQFYNENASVIYTDSEGRKIDTFVIFDTDKQTGLTHINHEDLKVPSETLRLHSKTACKYHLPIADAFSFEIIRMLKEKYPEKREATERRLAKKEAPAIIEFAKAS